MLPLILGWAVMAAAILSLAFSSLGRLAVLYWMAVAGCACALAAAAMAAQPVGQATLAGRFGYSVVHWGFRAGTGRLVPAMLISWLVWALLGAALITGIRARGDLPYRLLLLAWTIDVAALFYVLGVWLTRLTGGGSPPSSLLVMALILAAMVGTSWYLRSRGATAGATRAALLVAGGPTLTIAVGYGLFILAMLTMGRNARWN